MSAFPPARSQTGRPLSLAALLGTIAMAACGPGEPTGGSAPLLALPMPIPSPGCAAPLRLTEPRTIEIQLLAARGTSLVTLAEQLGSAVAFFAARDLTLSVTPAIIEVEDRPILGGRSEELDQVIAEAPPHAVKQVVFDHVIGELRGFLDRHARPRSTRINVVLLGRIASPRSPLARHLDHLGGLTIRYDEDSPWASAPHTTTLFLAETELVRQSLVPRRTTLIHELGHAFGLEHESDRENVMAQEPSRACVATLSPAQLSEVARALSTDH